MIEKNSLPDLLKTKAMENPHEVALLIPDNKNHWLSINFHSFYQMVVDLGWKFMDLGIKKGDVVAIMATMGHEWELIHHAILSLGGIVVGIDPDEKAEQLEAILKVAGIEILVIDRLVRLDIFCESIKAQLKSIITFDESSYECEIINSITIFGPKKPIGNLKIAPLPDVVQPDDIATIIFTSGTTGTPKGIAYRHDQIIAAIHAILQTFPELTQPNCHLACWMPLSNLFQRMVNLCAIASGAKVYIVNQPQKIIEFLPEINPHIFFAPPRFYEKLYQVFEDKLNHQPKVIVQFLYFCLTIADSNSLLSKPFKKINYFLFKSFRALVGSNICYMVSGSAPIQIKLLKRFDAMGLLILESYGLSENIVPIAANRLTEYRFGSVGKALKGNSVMLAEDGELLVKGPGVFNGYLADQQHDRCISADGYLASGDFAEIDSQGFIYLTGRKSEVFKTSTGRKIAPAGIESQLKSDTRVDHAVVFGEGRKFLVALITVASALPSDQGWILLYAQKLAADLTQCVSVFPKYKRPVGVILSFNSLSIEQQELTSNQKLRRKHIQKHYGEWIEQLYDLLAQPNSLIYQQPLLVTPEIVLLRL